MIAGVVASQLLGGQIPPPPPGLLLLSSSDELDPDANLLLSGDAQSNGDRLELSGDMA